MTKKLTTAELRAYEALLLAMLAEITGDIDHLQREALGSGEAPPDRQGDDGVDSWSQEFSLELLQHDESTVAEIREALDRIREGSFGRCEACEAWIRRTRLKAVPHARNCIDCQRQIEGRR
jgi:RNA polymerase-binding transcription factor DksA